MNTGDFGPPRLDRRTCLGRLAAIPFGAAAVGRTVAGDRPAAGTRVDDGPGPSSEPLTIEQSLRLAGQNLLAILDPKANYLPYWQLSVAPDYTATLQRWWPAHNLGRWLDAALRLEEAIHFSIPQPVETAMVENVRLFFDNPDQISIAPLEKARACGGDTRWDLHSLREGLLALNALARWRKSDWAVGQGRRMIRSLDEKLRDDGTWDLPKFDACRKRGPAVIHNTDPCDTHGRMLEALVWFFETTGEPAALRLADRIARFHFANTTTPDGPIGRAARADHTHSYLGTLRGLLLFGRLTHQRSYIDRVAAAYRVNVPRIVSRAGYASHNMAQESFGETTSPGDVAQLALWLFREGSTEFVGDTERIVRARILPSQIRETPPLRPPANDDADEHRELGRRIQGGFGGCHTHPHGGKQAVTDVTSADIHTLVDIYKNIVTTSEGRVEVLFHFDYEDARVKVAVRRGDRAALTVTPKSDAALALRVPHWAPRESVRVRVGGHDEPALLAGQFAWTGKLPGGSCVTMEYALPEEQTREKGLGKEYDVFWKGDDVVGVRPNTDFLPFYPDGPKPK